MRRPLFIAGVIGAFLLSVALAVPNVRLYQTERTASDVVASLRFVGNQLRAGAGEQMQAFFPEGYFFTHVLYGLAWLDVGRAGSLQREAVREARWALRRLDSAAGKAPFDASLRPAYGVFHAGWSARLRGGIVQVLGADAPETARFRVDCATLAAALRAEGPFLDAYPGQAWPVDSVVAVAALSLHDRVLGEAYGPVRRHWVRSVQAELDPRTGLMPHQVRPEVDGARGSSQSIIQRFLPEINQGWARTQYARFRDHFVVTELGLPGVREYPVGQDGPGDVDSGPLLLGVSASASVVTIGAARVHGDTELAGALTGLGEATGVPLRLGDTKRYALGVLPVGDAFLAWSAAAPTPPGRDRPAGEPSGGAHAYDNVVGWWWRLPWHLLGGCLLVVVWVPLTRRWRQSLSGSGPGRGRVTA